MALKATIFKAELTLADLDRNVYDDYALTLARHPSENDARMMVRLLAFIFHADALLAFGKGLSTDDEPDLWLKELSGDIRLWILVGQPDERWLRKAAGRAERVVVFSYGGRAAEVWWQQNGSALEKIANLSVYRLAPDDVEALAGLADRTMTLHCTRQDGEILISAGDTSLRVEPQLVFAGAG